jgi:hypothetical protein
MVDRLVVFATNPSRQLLPQRPDCTFMSLYRPHFPNNVESWQVFPDDERICAFIQNEPLKKKEIIYLEDNKFPKGLTPLESSFSSSDVGNKKNIEEEESKINIGDTVSLNIGTHDSPKILKVGAQCSDQEKKNSWNYSMNLRMFFPGHMRIFMVLILMSYNMLFLSRKKQNRLGKNKDLSILRSDDCPGFLL